MNGIGTCWAIKLELALAEITKARFVYRGRTDGGGMGDVNLLRASGIDAGKIAGRGSGGLKFGERVESVVVVEVVVDGGLLIVVEGML